MYLVMKTSGMLLTIFVLFFACFSNRKVMCQISGRQSPINIQPSIVPSSNKYVLNFYKYDKNVSGTIFIDQHTIAFKINETDSPILKIGDTLAYRLNNVHFHWNCTEHRINNISDALELHLVHKLQSESQSSAHEQNAMPMSVVAVLYELAENDNEALNGILDMIRNNLTPRSSASKNVTYRQVLPEKLKSAYQYVGSFTTPPYHETVLWNVIPNKQYISRHQIEEFQRLGRHSSNCRPVQPLNNRQIEEFLINEISSSSSAKVPSTNLYLEILVIIFVSLCITRQY